MNSQRTVLGVSFLLLLVIGLVISASGPSSVSVARDRCVAEGWQEQNLQVLRVHESQNLLGGRASVEFRVKDSRPKKNICVELESPLIFLGWRAVDYYEETPQQP
jgi:hypothetical protein